MWVESEVGKGQHFPVQDSRRSTSDVAELQTVNAPPPPVPDLQNRRDPYRR